MSGPNSPRDIRPSPIAGRWYPSNPTELADSIDRFMSRAEVAPPSGRIVGLLVPHAGHTYSGPVAGHAFKLIQGMEIDIVVLVGPSHYPYLTGVITTGHDAYATPLGEVPVERTILDQLFSTVPLETVRRDNEHSLEIELPFLQRTLGAFRLVPLALIDQSLALAERLGHALSAALQGQNALLVASSDLSHFYPQPVANKLDQVVLDAVAAFDPAGIIQAEERGEGFACGRGAIATVMIAAQALGADSAQILNYATSGDVTGEHHKVVGYGAAVFYQAD
ncbi:MAG: AmmeMemoRadiSam system protein B [Anaerolineae bacterium]|nr:AmmeMemoRadiSam system protein B [Anaerolineae bacterium]